LVKDEFSSTTLRNWNDGMIIKNGNVILPGQEEPVKLDIGIEGGRITSIGTDLHIEGEQIDAQDLLVLPGGIDPHVGGIGLDLELVCRIEGMTGDFSQTQLFVAVELNHFFNSQHQLVRSGFQHACSDFQDLFSDFFRANFDGVSGYIGGGRCVSSCIKRSDVRI